MVIIDTPGIDEARSVVFAGRSRVLEKRRILRFLSRTYRAVAALSSCSASRRISVCHRAQQGGFDFGSCRHAGKRDLRQRSSRRSNIRELKELIARAVKPTGRKNVWSLTCLRRMTQSALVVPSTQPHRKAG